ncbi:vacuolar import and degradation protein-domain-containing protein [Xylariomycetidae sp. FL2044]|nr:vacuolar import and degradation protein-domain-containing protein [Xylariomycetidae sp. FL2044]
MPTPSNNPPPHLPSRSHSSSCPEESRPLPSSWRPDQDGLEIDPDANERDATSSSPPEPVAVGAPPSSSTDTRNSTEGMRSPSRSLTQSLRPESTIATHPSSPGDTTENTSESPHHKSMGDDEDELEAEGSLRDRTDGDTRMPAAAAPTQRQGTSYGLTSSADPENDDLEDAIMLSAGSIQEESYAPYIRYDLTKIRIMPTSPSSFLRPGSKFHGTQQSERQVYEVQVEIKYVDLRESFLCGYLKIQGLTEDNPTLTTYFEGEIIGSKYGFITNHETWGASEKIDLNHWSKFAAFRPYSKQVRLSGNVSISNLAQRENIFMRWKEHFLVPDHRVTTINGASFEGFYYICFNQKEGGINGIYFHSKSEKFQQLDLKHVENKGCYGSMEFR